MKLMTYNILNGAKTEMEKVLSVVTDEAPDVLGINEANGFDKDHHKVLKEFASSSSFPYFDLAKCGDGDDYHVALFSKYPFKNLTHLSGFARAAIAADIKTPIGTISVIASHLTPYTEQLRMDEIEELISYDSALSYKVIMGDLNSLSRADEYDPEMLFAFNAMQTKKFTAKERLMFDATDKLLSAGYVDPAVVTGKQKVHTAPTSINEFRAHSNMRLDYILLSTQLADKLSGYKVLKDATTDTSSDHYPVVIELQ
ncbi:MAG: endonuclease/exonuclease/phosphatase family protein [Candidatus Saccharimonadales bacterium]